MPATVEIPMQDNNLYSQELSVRLEQEVESFRAIERSSIQYMKQLGGGNFGVVFLGKCKGLEHDEGSTLVAVKTLKEDSSNVAIWDFINEAKLLRRFQHEHIVGFHGVCMEELPYYLVFEYMDQGDLRTFLRMHSSSAQRRYNPPSAFRNRASTVSTDSASLGVTQLLHMCKQVASGMAYIESEKHIHCDLACRNCLIKTGMTVKVADFGMARQLHASDYVRVEGCLQLPIRWMAPESIMYGMFSSKSDVWSFGVVVWEVFSFAMQPYWGLSNGDVTDMIRQDQLLGKPEGCPENIFSMIKDSCWNREPSQRLTFANLVEHLDRLRLSDLDSSDFSTDIIDDNDDACDDSNKED